MIKEKLRGSSVTLVSEICENIGSVRLGVSICKVFVFVFCHCLFVRYVYLLWFILKHHIEQPPIVAYGTHSNATKVLSLYTRRNLEVS